MMSEENCKTAHDNEKKFGAWVLDTEEEIKIGNQYGCGLRTLPDETALAARN